MGHLSVTHEKSVAVLNHFLELLNKGKLGLSSIGVTHEKSVAVSFINHFLELLNKEKTGSVILVLHMRSQ